MKHPVCLKPYSNLHEMFKVKEKLQISKFLKSFIDVKRIVKENLTLSTAYFYKERHVLRAKMNTSSRGLFWPLMSANLRTSVLKT